MPVTRPRPRPLSATAHKILRALLRGQTLTSYLYPAASARYAGEHYNVVEATPGAAITTGAPVFGLTPAVLTSLCNRGYVALCGTGAYAQTAPDCIWTATHYTITDAGRAYMQEQEGEMRYADETGRGVPDLYAPRPQDRDEPSPPYVPALQVVPVPHGDPPMWHILVAGLQMATVGPLTGDLAGEWLCSECDAPTCPHIVAGQQQAAAAEHTPSIAENKAEGI